MGRGDFTARFTSFKPIFHYADFPETFPGRGSFGEVGVMEFGLYDAEVST